MAEIVITSIIHSPLGKLGIYCSQTHLERLHFLTNENYHLLDDSSSINKVVETELDSYFHNSHHEFQLPLAPSGTTYQQTVWRALQQIKPARPLTYGQLAQELGTHARAIGQACKRNPIPIIIPCHRIVAHSNLGGYMGSVTGAPRDRKTWLLSHEQPRINKNQL